MKNRIPFDEALLVLQDRDTFFQKINDQDFKPNLIWAQVLMLMLFSFIYGMIMGSYNSLLQAMVTGTKLWLLILITLLICFPSFYIVQLVLGSRVAIRQLVIIILSGFVMTTTVMLAFAPIVMFFQLSGDNYNFLQLLHVFVLVFSGFFGMKAVVQALTSAFESANVYPKLGVISFRVWVLIFAFVGMQLAWNMRPFVGSRELPFELFRESTRGNVYATLLGSFGELMGVQKKPPKEEKNLLTPRKK